MILDLLTVLVMVMAQPTPVDGWASYVTPPEVGTPAAIVAQCESGNLALAKNPNSTASGPWQFLDGTWEWVTGLEPPARKYPRHIQRQAFYKLWDEGRGASHWSPSEHCWGDKIGEAR